MVRNKFYLTKSFSSKSERIICIYKKQLQTENIINLNNFKK